MGQPNEESSKIADAAMERYAQGDDAAFGDVYDALAGRVFVYLRRQTRDHSRAEDLLQQTLMQMHRARASFIPGAEVTPWAFAIARRLLIDSLRKNKRQVPLTHDELEESGPPSREPAADDVLAARQLAARVEIELDRLPETQRVAFGLLRLDGLSIAEAAEVLGTTETAVKLRAHRAYEALRAVLGDVMDRKKER